MKSEYLRDLNRKYLVLTDLSEGYQMEMLLRNSSRGFVPFKRVEWDDERKLYFDITGMQSLEKGFIKRKITYEDLSELLYSISFQVKECKRLFLDVSGIVLSPEYIYRDLSTERFYWIYYPCDRDSHEIMDLAEYLLEHIDNGNQSVVKTTYELYRRAKEGSIDAENLYEILRSDLDNIPIEEKTPSQKNARNDDLSGNKEVNSFLNNKKSKLEQTIDRLFNLMKPQKEKNETENKEKIKSELCGLEYENKNDFEDRENSSETVLLSFPDPETRRLISRDNSIPDADLEFFPCVLGSRRDCVDILLNDRSVSRMHAQIDESQGKLFLYDLNSSNGTFLNGQRLISEEREIKEGDEIRIGNVRFVLA